MFCDIPEQTPGRSLCHYELEKMRGQVSRGFSWLLEDVSLPKDQGTTALQDPGS